MAALTVDISNVTNLAGTGNFDILCKSVSDKLMVEYAADRITGDKYAEAYIALMNNALNQSIQFTLQEANTNAQLEMTEEQRQLLLWKIVTEQAQTQPEVTLPNGSVVEVHGSVGKQIAVHEAQIKGFDMKRFIDNAKMRSEVTNVMISSQDITDIPKEFSKAAVDKAVQLVGNAVGQPPTP